MESRKIRIEYAAGLIELIRANLTPDLLHEQYRMLAEKGPAAGHCYVASEALYHIIGGRRSRFKPHSGRIGDIVHWWLEDDEGGVVDPTADQFPDGFPYEIGRGRGFLTRTPSRRAGILIARVLEAI